MIKQKDRLFEYGWSFLVLCWCGEGLLGLTKGGWFSIIFVEI